MEVSVGDLLVVTTIDIANVEFEPIVRVPEERDFSPQGDARGRHTVGIEAKSAADGCVTTSSYNLTGVK